MWTITQRHQSSATSPRWLVAVERTQTTPLLPLEFCLRPITSELVRRVSPGTTGWWNRHSAYPRFATALSEMSGTVLPNAMWNATRSSTGAGARPTDAANSADDGIENRVGYSAPYTARSPSVTVRGVACSITCPTVKSSKKLPPLVLDAAVISSCSP